MLETWVRCMFVYLLVVSCAADYVLGCVFLSVCLCVIKFISSVIFVLIYFLVLVLVLVLPIIF